MPSVRKKELGCALFLAFLLVMTIGSSGLLVFMHCHIKSSVQLIVNQIADNELIPISKTYFEHSEDVDEMIVEGCFYDVVKYEIKSGVITYFCYFDKAETNLHRFFTGLLTSTEHITDPKTSYLFLISQIKFINYSFDFCFNCQSDKLFYSQLSAGLPPVYPGVNTPPPQIL